MNFKDFKKDVESAFNAMIADNLFVVNVDKDLLWMSYLLGMTSKRWDFLEQRPFSNTSKLTLRTM